jgi:hypothetical protein
VVELALTIANFLGVACDEIYGNVRDIAASIRPSKANEPSGTVTNIVRAIEMQPAVVPATCKPNVNPLYEFLEICIRQILIFLS